MSKPTSHMPAELNSAENLIGELDEMAQMNEILDEAAKAMGLLPNMTPRVMGAFDLEMPDEPIEIFDDDLEEDTSEESDFSNTTSSVPPFTKRLWRHKVEAIQARKEKQRKGIVGLRNPLLNSSDKEGEEALADVLMDIRRMSKHTGESADNRERGGAMNTLTQLDTPLKPHREKRSFIHKQIFVVAVVAVVVFIGIYMGLVQTSESETAETAGADFEAEYEALKKQLKAESSSSKQTPSRLRASSKKRAEQHRAEDESTADKIEANLKETFGQGIKPLSTQVTPSEQRAGRTRVTVSRAMSRVAPSIKKCGKGSHGTVVISVVIAPSGEVTNAVAGAGTPVAIAKCAVRAVKRARFPSSDKATTVKYPFTY